MPSHANIVLLLHCILYCSSALGAPILKREVPQEHSHNEFLASVRTSLAKNNPNNIQDPVFGLLGNAAAASGQGKITNTDCLHLATADQAFSNAKADGDVQGMTDALIYAALERNTGKVGLASVLCTAIKATNPEVAAISQHQDPASANAAATNKGIVLELAKQIASIGGDPQQALKSGTFAPGNLDDNTAKGNTCDDANDTVGCIFTQNLLVEDATPAEINAAVAGVAPAANASAIGANTPKDASSSAAAPAAPAADANSAAPATSGSRSALDFGSCSNPTIKFGLGFDGRNQNSFEPENETDFNHGSALNIKVIADFICGQLSSKCKASAATVAACQTGEAAALKVGNTGGAADTFNAALGFTTDFAVTADNTSTGPAVASVSPTTTTSVSVAAAAAVATVSGSVAAASADGTSSSSATSASAPGNLQTFTGNLGGVLPPPVTAKGNKFCVTGNACFNSVANALQRSCDVQHNKCADASNAAGQKATFSVAQCGTQQTQCGAHSTGSTVSDAATGNASSSMSKAAAPATPACNASSDVADASTSSSVAADAATSSSGNLQRFTGDLGGVQPPPVTAKGKQFCVSGNACFNALANALERSCDVQHNKCADASNAAGQKAAFSVSQCQTQQTQCDAKAKSS